MLEAELVDGAGESWLVARAQGAGYRFPTLCLVPKPLWYQDRQLVL